MTSKTTAAGDLSWARVGRTLAIALTALVLVSVAATMQLAPGGGAFMYSLDDPYIHLAVAEEILRGGYGVNVDEAAAASSSPVYPVLLAGLLSLGLGSWGPLVVNLAATAAALALAVATWAQAGLRAPASSEGRITAIGIVFLLALNVVGLAFTGMEHSLQTTMGLAALLGAVRFARSGRVEAWWVLILAAQTLVRYEGLAIALAGAVLLALHRRWLSALLALGGAAGVLVGFGAFLVSRGLPPAPSSVLVKGGDLAAAQGIGGRIGALVEHALSNIGDQPGLVFLAFVIGFAVVALRRADAPPPGSDADAQRVARDVALFAGLIVAAHLAVGRFGWWQRYETYALILAMTALPVVFPGRFRALATGKDWGALTIALLFAAMAFQRNVTTTLESAPASQNIYLQQYQMHRFAADHLRAPVAVNDLGWVSFENPAYVLDLWGLGSEQARLARAGAQGPGWIDDLARAKGVKVAMVYESWFTALPPSWRRLGTLELKVGLKSVADGRVTFFLVDPAAGPEVAAKLDAWAATLPRKAAWTPDPAFAATLHPAPPAAASP